MDDAKSLDGFSREIVELQSVEEILRALAEADKSPLPPGGGSQLQDNVETLEVAESDFD